jgi:hypothetical protein
MKQSVSPAVVAVAIVVIVAVIGFFAYRTFASPKSGPTLPKEEYAKRQSQMYQGGTSASQGGANGGYASRMRGMSGGMSGGR